ncbi:hypothetical protein E1091_00135 [Micromonospora fluostatini]|uniref:Uncharacterized protein n=1 Tax=Micromonospora fluostatini TaxID=1629071 RepID=A0ABY2DME7_9ACTN|nr:hypothetical protein E1091_00135 [Micromonospora fluostatini]
MFRLKTLRGDEVQAALAGAFVIPPSCDRCGDDLDIHDLLVVEFSKKRWQVVGCDRKPRVWRMWARRQVNAPDGRDFRYFGSAETVARPWLGSGKPTEVELTEDPDGSYWGWIDCQGETGHAGIPVMIEPHEGMFRMQEPNGFDGKAARGYGEIVRMTLRKLRDGR